jgi:hypothetical protein
MIIRPVGVELFCADGRTDRQTADIHDEASSRLSKFCKRAWKRQYITCRCKNGEGAPVLN